MIHLLIILNLLILPLLFWRFFAFAFALIGVLLWKLRYVVAVFVIGFIGCLYYGYWCGQHPVLPASDPTYIATHQNSVISEQQKSQTSDQWLKEQLAKWPQSIPVTGQPTSGPITVTGQPEVAPEWPLGTRYVMEDNTHQTGHLLPNGRFVPDPGQ